MVDSVKSQSLGVGPSKQAEKNKQTSPSAVASSVKDAGAVLTDKFTTNFKGPVPDRVSKMLRDLSDAVSHSSLALEALERFAGSESEISENEISEKLKHDVGSLQESISAALDQIKSQVGKAEVLSENLSASNSSLVDLEAAQKRAQGVAFVEVGSDAINAHIGLSAEKVLKLLADS